MNLTKVHLYPPVSIENIFYICQLNDVSETVIRTCFGGNLAEKRSSATRVNRDQHCIYSGFGGL